MGLVCLYWGRGWSFSIGEGGVGASHEMDWEARGVKPGPESGFGRILLDLLVFLLRWDVTVRSHWSLRWCPRGSISICPPGVC